MNRPRNAYEPGNPLPTELHAIGRPVTMFGTGNDVRAGIIVRVATAEDYTLTYDIHTTGGGLFTNQRLGTLMNPQPNTFVFAP